MIWLAIVLVLVAVFAAARLYRRLNPGTARYSAAEGGALRAYGLPGYRPRYYAGNGKLNRY